MNKRDLRHIHLYQNKQGQTILYNAKKKEGHLIPEGDVGKIAALQYRYHIVFAIGILIHFLLDLQPWLTLAIMAGVFVLGEYTYRVSMLKKYETISNYVPHNVLDKSVASYQQSKQAMVTRIGLDAQLGGLLIYSTIRQPITQIETHVL